MKPLIFLLGFCFTIPTIADELMESAEHERLTNAHLHLAQHRKQFDSLTTLVLNIEGLNIKGLNIEGLNNITISPEDETPVFLNNSARPVSNIAPLDNKLRTQFFERLGQSGFYRLENYDGKIYIPLSTSQAEGNTIAKARIRRVSR